MRNVNTPGRLIEVMKIIVWDRDEELNPEHYRESLIDLKGTPFTTEDIKNAVSKCINEMLKPYIK